MSYAAIELVMLIYSLLVAIVALSFDEGYESILFFSATSFVIQNVFYFCFFAPLVTRYHERRWSLRKYLFIAQIPFVLFAALNPLFPLWLMLLVSPGDFAAPALLAFALCIGFSTSFAFICLRIDDARRAR